MKARICQLLFILLAMPTAYSDDVAVITGNGVPTASTTLNLNCYKEQSIYWPACQAFPAACNTRDGEYEFEYKIKVVWRQHPELGWVEIDILYPEFTYKCPSDARGVMNENGAPPKACIKEALQGNKQFSMEKHVCYTVTACGADAVKSNIVLDANHALPQYVWDPISEGWDLDLDVNGLPIKKLPVESKCTGDANFPLEGYPTENIPLRCIGATCDLITPVNPDPATVPPPTTNP